jgi:putative membrane protein
MQSVQKHLSFAVLGLSLATAFLIVAPVASAAAASDTDKAFVGKVSQGGAYEVAASKVAEQMATSQKVKNLALTEVQDHDQVNMKLKKLAAAHQIPVAPKLNDEFQQRLDKLKGTSGAAFDGAYISDMQQIHDKDEKLFAQENIDGSADFKPFAYETDNIVKRHIAALQALSNQ